MSWEKVKIPDVLFFQEGPGVRNTQFTSSGVKLLNVGNINFGDLNLETTKVYISEDQAFGKYHHFLVDEGDLLIASSGIVVDNFHNKITWAREEHLPLCLNTSTIRFKSLNDNVLDLKYFSYFLKTRLFADQLSKLITGSAQLNFGPSHLKQISLPLPPLASQKRIAEILDAADALRRKDQELLKKYDELAQGIFIDMFGDPVKNEKGWEAESLGDICDFFSGKAWKNSELSSRGFKLIRISNLHKPDFPYWHFDGKLIQKHIVEDGDLLFSWAGVQSSIDVYLYSGETAMLNQHIFNIKPKNQDISRKFLFDVIRLHLKNLRLSLGGGVGQFHLKKEDVTGIRIILPGRVEMKHYIDAVNKLDSQISFVNLNALNSENVFNSLIQKAFKGELVV